VGALALWVAGLAALLVLHLKGAGARLGRRVAALARALVAVYCGTLSVAHARARTRAEVAAQALAGRAGERVLRVAATPVLADPLTWRCLSETDRSTTRFDMGFGAVFLKDLRNVVSVARPAGEDEEVVRRASEDYPARVLLDFARFPVARVRRADSGGWVVQFADLRFTEPGARSGVGGFALDVPVNNRQ